MGRGTVKNESESRSVMSNSVRPHGLLQARILEWVAFSLLQQIFPTQELNQGPLHCRQILYQLSYEGSPQRKQILIKSYDIYTINYQSV